MAYHQGMGEELTFSQQVERHLVRMETSWDGFEAGVSWSSIGKRTPREAEIFARGILRAAKKAREHNLKQGKRPKGTGGYMDPANPTGYYSR